jgi:hypothetical protein
MEKTKMAKTEQDEEIKEQIYSIELNSGVYKCKIRHKTFIKEHGKMFTVELIGHPYLKDIAVQAHRVHADDGDRW